MNKASTTNYRISFTPLSEEHFSLMHTWFNELHVQSFYSLRTWTIEEVRQKLTPYIQGMGDMECYIISIDKTPIGYVQCYPVKKHPWDNQNLVDEVLKNSAGMDLFIGEKELIGKGLGCQILDAFLENYIWTRYRYCLVDPDVRNEISIRLFKKCGFQEYQQINSKDALQRPVTLQLLIRDKQYPLIRSLHKSDIPKIVRRYSFPWSTPEKTQNLWDTYYQEQEDKVRTVAVIEKDGEILGYGSLLRKPACPFFAQRNIPEINAIWIDEDHRRKGLGTALIKWLENLASQEGYDQIGIGVGLYRDYGPAQQLYFQLGYIPEGNGITYKGESTVAGQSYPLDDDLILWLKKPLSKEN